MAKSKLVAVVVTHNRLAQLKVTLARLCEASPDDLTGILVYDNASDDGTSDWLAIQSDPRLAVISGTVNLGGAGGFEQGMRAAVDLFDPDWLVLMDDDARPAPGTFATFNAEPRGAYDGFASAVRYPDGEICDMNRPWINPLGGLRAIGRTIIKRRNGFHLPRTAYDEPPRPIDGASFVGLFLSRQAIEKAGYPDGNLFIYGDDVLYTLALSAAGGRLCFDPALTFEHDCGVANVHGVLAPLWKAYFYHRNQVLVTKAAAGPVLSGPLLVLRTWQWRTRAGRYGSQAGTYRRLLELGLADARDGNFSRSLAEVRVISDER